MRPQAGSSGKDWGQMMPTEAGSEVWLPLPDLGGLALCSELCTKGFQPPESPGVLGWVSEKLLTP